MALAPSLTRKRLSASGRGALCTISVLVFLVSAEAVCRTYFAARIGLSVLFYGTSFERAAVSTDEQSPLLRNLRDRRMSGVGDRNHSVRHADNQLAGYFKYYPHQRRSTYDIDTGEVYPVTINARGFRGPEFDDEKRPGVIRVVTLGASSTFGYHDRDDLTYPAQLQHLLNVGCPSEEFEVINLGIPHLTSTQILALFAAEGVRLNPDVVTFYEGFNDANELEDSRPSHKSNGSKRPSTKRLGRWAREHFVLGALADALLSNWTRRYSSERIAAHVETTRRRFLENLTKLIQMSREEGFIPIIVSQQSRSLLVPREEIRGVTFRRELELVSAELARKGWLGRKEAAFLTHGDLMQAEAEWAHERGVPFVDVRSALDQRRDTVVSWVHLSHEGNLIVAERLAPPILERTCPDRRINAYEIRSRPKRRRWRRSTGRP